jgi:hypothetical protein
MKLKLEIDLDGYEFDNNEQLTISDAIKDAIIYEVKNSVLSKFKGIVESEITKIVCEEVEKNKQSYILNVMDDMIVNQQLKKRYSSTEMISIADYVKEEIERMTLKDDTLKNYLNKISKEKSDSISKELKDRYDLLFASQIVSKLHENGMLKDDVARLLLTENGNK